MTGWAVMGMTAPGSEGLWVWFPLAECIPHIIPICKNTIESVSQSISQSLSQSLSQLVT